MKKILIGIVFIGIILGVFFFLNKKEEITPINSIACTQEAKQCPDGSYVGRTGPNCEFTECPTPQIKETNTAFLNQKILNGGVYITPLQVVSDSRCPIDVQCVWAGEIVIKVKLEKGEISKEIELKQGASVIFEKSNVSFVSVVPENKAKIPILLKDYQFTFKVVSIVNQGTVSGTVTLSPTCPIERIPPDPNCAPKPYSTSIDIKKTESNIITKTIQSDAYGKFRVDLDSSTYILQAHGGNVLPRCGEVSVEVKSGQYANTEISCDTGIR